MVKKGICKGKRFVKAVLRYELIFDPSHILNNLIVHNYDLNIIYLMLLWSTEAITHIHRAKSFQMRCIQMQFISYAYTLADERCVNQSVSVIIRGYVS